MRGGCGRLGTVIGMRAQAIATLAIAGLLAGSAPAIAAGPWQTLRHQGIERSYLIHTPDESVMRNGPVPLVLVLHGGGGNADNAERMTGFTEKAQKEGFIVVYPDGSGRFRDKLLTWNAGHCCGYAMERDADDTSFVRALIDRLIENHPVDPRRVYATGMSNGGMMAHRLGRELSGKLAAIAPVVATVFGDEKRPTHPVSALMVNGMLDKSVPHEGGPPGGQRGNARGDLPSSSMNATDVIWEFFRAHAKQIQ